MAGGDRCRQHAVCYTLAMLKQFLMKKLIARQLASLPAEQRKMIEDLVEKNPDLFMQLAQEVQAEMAAGKSQQDAMMAVAMKNKDTLGKLMGK